MTKIICPCCKHEEIVNRYNNFRKIELLGSERREEHPHNGFTAAINLNIYICPQCRVVFT